MKKRLFLVLGLLCGIILPLSTQAYEDGIYTGLVDKDNGNGVITVIWSGIKMTLKSENQTGTYGRGNNIAGDSTNYFGAENNDRWGGGADTYENGFNPNPSDENKIARRGPCDSGYHVPSRGEWNELVTAWCNLTTGCSLTESYDQSKNSGSNKLISISYVSGMGIKFKQDFNMSYNDFWSSSPVPGSIRAGLALGLYDSSVVPYNTYSRDNSYRVRCFKNVIVEPLQTFTITFLSGDVYVWSGVAISGSMYTGDVPSTDSVDPLPNMTKEGYEFDGWFLEGESEAFEFSGTAITGNLELYAKWTAEEYTITYLGTGDDYKPIATGYTVESGDITLSKPSKTGYTFTGRSGTNIEGITGTVTIPKGSTGDRIYEANWEANEYTITIDIDGNETILTGKYGDPISKPADPSKNGYKFIGWEPEFPTTMPLSGATVKAKWEKLGSSGGGGGGSKSSDKDKDTTNNPSVTDVTAPLESGAQGDSNDGSSLSRGDTASAERGSTQNYTQEFQEAYEFAHEKGITTMPTIQEAQMDGKLTRIAMAKMLSQYAMNVLGQKPANIVTPKFNDVTDKQNSDYDDGVTLAYQLGIMGQNMPGNNFRPNDEVTRAEFATALSRMAYGTLDGEYKATSKYYVHHMEKLVKEGIITNDDPNMKELRGYVMIMLMRSAK